VHKLLERQVRRYYGAAPPRDPLFVNFVGAVDAAYCESDSDRALLERSIDLASAELFDRNTQLESDLEAIKRLELGLFQAEKLRAVGQLAAGIAHEINTPIQYVGDSVHFLKTAFSDFTQLGERVREICQALERGETTAELLVALQGAAADVDLDYLLCELPKAFEQTLDGIRRVANIVAAMKEFGRVDQADKVLTDLGRCLNNTLTVAHNELKYLADVELTLEPVPAVLCHPGELSQVLLNLLVNAAHAIDDRFHQDGQRGRVRVGMQQQANEVVISIADNGCGIPESLKVRIFEPFFTTKPVGKGSGQGLAISRSMIEKQGGSLSFESRENEGTTFFVRIPLETHSGVGMTGASGHGSSEAE
jgi:two-component system, NtrC family, sensor kinase